MARSRLREYFHSDYQPGERLLVQKIDFFILTFCCVSYFMNYVSKPPPHPVHYPQELGRNQLFVPHFIAITISCPQFLTAWLTPSSWTAPTSRTHTSRA